MVQTTNERSYTDTRMQRLQHAEKRHVKINCATLTAGAATPAGLAFRSWCALLCKDTKIQQQFRAHEVAHTGYATANVNARRENLRLPTRRARSDMRAIIVGRSSKARDRGITSYTFRQKKLSAIDVAWCDGAGNIPTTLGRTPPS